MRPLIPAVVLAAAVAVSGGYVATTPTAAPTAATAATAAGFAPGPSSVGVPVLVTLDARLPDVAAAARAALPAGGRVERTYEHVLRGFAATVPEQAVAALERAPGVVRVERDVVLRKTATQPSPPIGLDRIDQRARPLDSSYTFSRTGSGVTAYVVDTGIRRTHSDFGGRASTGFDAVTPGGAADDCDGHGTHVAGTVGGSRFGVAKSVSLRAVRVLDCDGAGSGSTLLAGLDYIVRDHAEGAPAVAVLSLGGSTESTTVDTAVRRVVADGVSVSVAAGNENLDACTTSPARVPEALTVGASDSTSDVRAPFSNKGACLDLFAPGVGILSAGHTSDTATLVSSGTSMSAPHVAGAAALQLQADPAAAPDVVAQRLREATTKGIVADAQSPAADLLFVNGVATAPALLTPSPSATASPAVQAPGGLEDAQGRFTPLTPSRVLDTRDGGGRLAPGAPRELQVTGRGGVPPTGVSAVALNVTATGPDASGHVTVYPAGSTVPTASNLNYVRGQTVANLVLTGVSDNGRVALVSNTGRPHVIADVVGYYSDTLGGSRSRAVTPARLLDSRAGLGRLPSGRPVPLDVAGRGGVPDGATAAILNVTATNPLDAGHLTVFPGGRSAPTASNLNYRRGGTVPNLVVVGLAADGSVQLQANAGSPHVVVDVVGWYGEQGDSRFVPVAPQRVLDTRDAGGRIAPGASRLLTVGGRGDVPSLGVSAVVLNVTATGASRSGFLTVYPGSAAQPVASNVNYGIGQTVPNLVFSGAGAEPGQVRIFSNAGSPHVVVDVVGYTTATATSTP